MLTLAEKKPKKQTNQEKKTKQNKTENRGMFCKNQTRDENISTQQREIIVARGRVGQCTQAD